MTPGWWNGRHSRLKICFFREYGFESRPGYQFSPLLPLKTQSFRGIFYPNLYSPLYTPLFSVKKKRGSFPAVYCSSSSLTFFATSSGTLCAPLRYSRIVWLVFPNNSASLPGFKPVLSATLLNCSEAIPSPLR